MNDKPKKPGHWELTPPRAEYRPATSPFSQTWMTAAELINCRHRQAVSLVGPVKPLRSAISMCANRP